MQPPTSIIAITLFKDEKHMAQESAQLNKNLLKHLRNQKAETQAKTAEEVGLSDRQYQNIEKNGRTTLEKINAIAAHFDISTEKLMTNISEDNSLWYVTTPYSITPDVTQGYDKAIEDIKTLAKRNPDIFKQRLTITEGPQVQTISVTFHEQEFTWTIRPVELNEKIGLVWTELSDWQQDTWEITRDELLYGYVDDVYLNDNRLVPPNATAKFIVEFKECGQRKIIFTGYRIFDSAAEFRVSLAQWLNALPIFIEPRQYELGMLNMVYGFTDEMTKTLCIYKVWINENGERMQAPWPVANIEKLISTMKDWKSGKRKWALPIAIGENFEGEDAAPIEPDVTYHKVTELPEISIIFEKE